MDVTKYLFDSWRWNSRRNVLRDDSDLVQLVSQAGPRRSSCAANTFVSWAVVGERL